MRARPSISREAALGLMLRRQHLAQPAAAGELVRIAGDILGLHATELFSPFLQACARLAGFTAPALEEALDSGRLLKLTCMRGTLFVVPAELAPLLFAGTREVMEPRTARSLSTNAIARADYERLAEQIEVALAGRTLDARSIRADVGAEGPIGVVLRAMCDEGRLVRWKGGRGWQRLPQTYARFADALPHVTLGRHERSEAMRAVVELCVRTYGPIGEADIAWFAGWKRSSVRAALAATPGLVAVDVAGLEHEALLLEEDLEAALTVPAPAPDDVRLLGVLDPYVQNYRSRELFLEREWLPFAVDAGGNATSLIVAGGRAVGVWDGAEGELRLLFFSPPDPALRRATLEAAEALARFLWGGGAVRVLDRMQPLDVAGSSALRPLPPART